MKRLLFLLLALLGFGIWGVNMATVAHAQVTPDNFEVMLVVDTSGSMQGSAIDQTRSAAAAFVDDMPATVRIGLVSFGQQVAVNAPPTTDRGFLKDQIGSLVAASDHTLLYDGVVAGVQSFTPAATHRALVVLSDGRDTGSTNQLQQAVNAVQGSHVEAISLTTAETDVAALQALGTVTPADDPAGLSAAFSRVTDLLTKVVATTLPPTTVAPTTVPATVAPATVAPTTVATTAYTRPAPSAQALQPSHMSFPWLGAGAIFVALVALVMLVWPRQRVSRSRLGIEKPKRASDIGQRTMSLFEEMARRGDLATNLSVADVHVKPAEFVALVVVIALVAGLVGLFLFGPLLAVGLAVAVCLAVRVFVSRKKAKRQAAFAEQLPDVLQLLMTSLRSGYGLTQALDAVAEEAEEPARTEFAHVLVETRLGRDLSESMQAMARRMENQDLEWVIGAIDINRDTGGNLSEILSQVGATIRERARMKRQVRTLTAEGRMSARILTGLPLVMAFWQWRANPDNFALLTQGVGLVLLVMAGVLMTLGWLWVRKIVNGVAL